MPILAASCARRCSCILVRMCSEGQETMEPARPAAPPAARVFQCENSLLAVGNCGADGWRGTVGGWDAQHAGAAWAGRQGRPWDFSPCSARSRLASAWTPCLLVQPVAGLGEGGEVDAQQHHVAQQGGRHAAVQGHPPLVAHHLLKAAGRREWRAHGGVGVATGAGGSCAPVTKGRAGGKGARHRAGATAHAADAVVWVSAPSWARMQLLRQH